MQISMIPKASSQKERNKDESHDSGEMVLQVPAIEWDMGIQTAVLWVRQGIYTSSLS
jgi:hypothetical protein